MTEKNLVEEFRERFERTRKIEQQLEEEKAALERVKQSLLDLMEAAGTERTATYEGVGFITRLKPRIYASYNRENEDALFNELERISRTDIIRRTIHPQTLAAFVSERIEAGDQIPQQISYALKHNIRLYTK